ncbi:MAG: HEPN domain-containing protein [Firmicutes bacterium]|nr:HEPN domain-containing protein [Bacillota bacterium]
MDLARAFLATARDDLRAARVLLAEELWAASCFFSQQAAEKAAKAWLCAAGVAPPRSHYVSAVLSRLLRGRGETGAGAGGAGAGGAGVAGAGGAPGAVGAAVVGEAGAAAGAAGAARAARRAGAGAAGAEERAGPARGARAAERRLVELLDELEEYVTEARYPERGAGGYLSPYGRLGRRRAEEATALAEEAVRFVEENLLER